MNRNEQNSKRLKTLEAAVNNCKTKYRNTTIYVGQIQYDKYVHYNYPKQIFRLP